MTGIYRRPPEGEVPMLTPLFVSFIKFFLIFVVVLDTKGMGILSFVLLTPSKLVVVIA